MRALAYILSLMIFCGGWGYAQEVSAQFEQANKLYQQEKFEEAAEAYTEILKLGYESAGLYYNLGNCYFQSDQLGPAILNYRRAENIDPYDEEIRHNLKLARAAAIDDFEKMPLPLFKSAYLSILLLLNADTWAGMGIGSLVLVLIGTFLYLFTGFKRGGFVVGFTGLLGAILFISLAVANNAHQQRNIPAIIMTASSYAKSGPGEKAEDVFILHEGAEVQVTESFDDWCKLRLPDGKVGWIHSSDLEEI